MFNYNIEYRENILFIRLIGNLNKDNITQFDNEIKYIIYKLGIYNIVFNFEQLDSIDSNSITYLIDYYNLLKKRKGVSLVCGVHGCLKNSGLLNYMKEISSELCAIRVINWNN